MSTSIEHKRGDTFLFSAVLRESKAGPAINLAGWTIESMIRDANGALIAELTVTVADATNGAYTISESDTTAWPIGAASWDIQYTDDNDIIRSTETVRVNIIEDVTFPDPEPAP